VTTKSSDELQVRVQGEQGRGTLIYLPGIQGDWTLIASFRKAALSEWRFVEFTYPRSTAWSLADYARAVREALEQEGIREGWLIGESFGSQVAWAVIDLEAGEGRGPAGGADSFQVLGLILAGGFVRHPCLWGVRGALALWRRMPARCLRALLKLYVCYAPWRYRRAPETMADLPEFVSRRDEADHRATAHRLELILGNDLRPVARRFDRPVFYLGGAIDPLVPWPWVRAWLRRHCPGYRGGRTFWMADHNVLASSARSAAVQVGQWLNPLLQFPP